MNYFKLSEEDRKFELDHLLGQYRIFTSELRNNYVSKYCMHIFMDMAQIQDFESFRHFFEETTQSIDEH